MIMAGNDIQVNHHIPEKDFVIQAFGDIRICRKAAIANQDPPRLVGQLGEFGQGIRQLLEGLTLLAQSGIHVHALKISGNMVDDFAEQDPPHIVLFLLFSQTLGHHLRSRSAFFLIFNSIDLGKQLRCGIIQVYLFVIHGRHLCGSRQKSATPEARMPVRIPPSCSTGPPVVGQRYDFEPPF